MDTRDALRSMLNNMINDKSEQASLDLHNYLSVKMKEVSGITEKTEEITEAKSMVDPWAKAMIKTSGLRIPGSAFVDMDPTGDGHFVPRARAEVAIKKLEDEGHTVTGKAVMKTIKCKDDPKCGMTFDFDDPEDEGQVRIHMFNKNKK